MSSKYELWGQEWPQNVVWGSNNFQHHLPYFPHILLICNQGLNNHLPIWRILFNHNSPIDHKSFLSTFYPYQEYIPSISVGKLFQRWYSAELGFFNLKSKKWNNIRFWQLSILRTSWRMRHWKTAQVVHNIPLYSQVKLHYITVHWFTILDRQKDDIKKTKAFSSCQLSSNNARPSWIDLYALGDYFKMWRSMKTNSRATGTYSPEPLCVKVVGPAALPKFKCFIP